MCHLTLMLSPGKRSFYVLIHAASLRLKLGHLKDTYANESSVLNHKQGKRMKPRIGYRNQGLNKIIL
jgi:hypothetical protein